MGWAKYDEDIREKIDNRTRDSGKSYYGNTYINRYPDYPSRKPESTVVTYYVPQSTYRLTTNTYRPCTSTYRPTTDGIGTDKGSAGLESIPLLIRNLRTRL